MNKTVLFFNLASESSNEKGLPFIRAARQLGCRVVSVTHEGESELLCGDINEVVALSNMDRIRNLISEYEVDFAMTVNSRLTPWLAREIEASDRKTIRSFSEFSARTLNYKDACAVHLATLGLNAVEHWIPTSNDAWASIPDHIPLLLKPTFSTGAVDTVPFVDKASLLKSLESGVRCETLNEIVTREKFHEINRSGRIFGRWMIQRRVDFEVQIGLEIAVIDGQTTIVHAGEILTLADEGISAYAHIGPVVLPSDIERGIKSVITSLQIRNANLTPDILVDREGRWYLIDANLNVGGEGLIDLLAARGLDYPLESLRGFLGEQCDFTTNSMFAASTARPTFKAGALRNTLTSSTLDALRRIVG